MEINRANSPQPMPSRKHYFSEMQQELEELQMAMRKEWLGNSLPEDWHGMDSWQRLDRPKTRVTIRLDADMVRWFRKLGPNYSRRINAVLRIYWMALLSGHIQAHERDDTILRIALNAQRRQREEREERERRRE
ncbi:BrnA antitoxin family protein [Phaeobacter gallaeciensis]|uniref:BrnA antitoxin family protein n=2 Tax=Phaeobacter gallaeciensis TaxID=60890 RepID=UPI00237F7390|nr:BrnA antitoxin family protein [Phaeobacter gallaeciensis]MDE4303481.1 BrnA antitoxin family protein [Phaeobacter gallaeciensis]MDE4308037.1 BrnA antitoxin family protein [Phaeobacter gallaeciensis]MDE4312495.1 BrnA antitoxin family protein [Phaeobacter gallaeciensis]MDE4316966.1 BrnA antitoxin family protein [Phaeobacter gallaeciensis]MDE4321429.1 BrnA antitoxin family protein [Phaeobacter gallaeciensis]